MLFREVRTQILVQCIWDDQEPPSFLCDWNSDLSQYSPGYSAIIPVDEMSSLIFDFARLKHQIGAHLIADTVAMGEVTRIEMRAVQWSINAMNNYPDWAYSEIEVAESPHVWNGLVHDYSDVIPASVWNTYRSMRIMLTRTQESLCRRLNLTQEQAEEQLVYYKSIRRRMTDEICAGIPRQFGHAAPARNSHCKNSQVEV
jgi:hypothetical protein